VTAPPSRRAAWAALAGVALLALVLRTAGLSRQPLINDDVDVGQTAFNFVVLGWPEPTMWNHPRLRDLLVYGSTQALGDGPWGLKLASVALGTLSVPLAAGLVLALTGSVPAAALAGVLLATDPLHLDFSRQAINDVYLAALPIGAILALLAYRRGRRPAWLALAGVLLGLGVATKWSAAFPVLFAAAVVLDRTLREAPDRRARAAELALFGSCLGALALGVYLLTYWPWFGRGHDLAEWVALHRAMASETATHTGYAGTKLPGYPGEVVGAWRWFLQPIWYVDYVLPGPGRALPPGGLFVSGVANPLTWLATLPAAAWAAVRWARARDGAAGWLLGLFLAAYLPFALVPRPVWTNSAVAVAPFAIALVGWAAARLHERLRTPVRAWVAVALLLAAALWLPATGVSSGVGDRALRALVSPAALDPANHPAQ
jgi:4-amino-4-deoxy-L-arabinose transferase-like glycosyltransferase